MYTEQLLPYDGKINANSYKAKENKNIQKDYFPIKIDD